MKLTILGMACAAIVASSAVAYVQPGHLPQTTAHVSKTPTGDNGGSAPIPHVLNDDSGIGANQKAPGGVDAPGDHLVNPVPEPGTMALVSMGLIALGIAARRRKGR